MSKWYEFELGKAADILTRELFKLKEGETFVITADTESDMRVVEATARAAFSLGAKPMVIWTPAALGVGAAADPMLPQEALVGALKGADAWVEFNNQWIFYSETYTRAMKENDRLRYSCLVGMNADMMVRCIGRLDYPTLGEFMAKITDLTNMMKMAHICYGFNPGAKLTGDIVEDERVWGCVEWGIGHMRSAPAPSHSDGICLNASVWLDGEQVLDRGRSVHPELAELAKRLGKQ